MVRCHAPFQGLLELVALGPQAAPCQVGQSLDIALAGEDRLQHGPGRDPVDICHNRGELQVRIL